MRKRYYMDYEDSGNKKLTSLKKLKEFYQEEIDEEDYETLDCWLWEMEKMGFLIIKKYYVAYFDCGEYLGIKDWQRKNKYIIDESQLIAIYKEWKKNRTIENLMMFNEFKKSLIYDGYLK